MQSEPVGSWWERSPGVPVDALLAANDGSGAVAGPGDTTTTATWVSPCSARRWPGSAAPRGGTSSPRELLEPLGMTRTTYLPAAPHAQGLSVDHFAETLTQEPHQDTRGMAPAGQAWSTVADLARWADFLATGHPDVLARTTLDEMATAHVARVRAGAAAHRPRRAAAHWPHGLDARLPGQPLRGPGDAPRQRADDERLRRAVHGGGPGSAAGRRRARRRRAVAAQHRRTRRASVACPACGSGATPPSSCAGTTAGCACTRPDATRTPTSSR